MPDFLQAFLSDHDTPCPSCGYNLKGITTPTCPECGASLLLIIAADQPATPLWARGLIGLSFSAAWTIILVPLLLSLGPLWGMLAIALAMVLLIMLRDWAVSRERIQALPAAAQLRRVWLCWTIPILIVGAIATVIAFNLMIF